MQCLSGYSPQPRQRSSKLATDFMGGERGVVIERGNKDGSHVRFDKRALAEQTNGAGSRGQAVVLSRTLTTFYAPATYARCRHTRGKSVGKKGGTEQRGTEWPPARERETQPHTHGGEKFMVGGAAVGGVHGKLMVTGAASTTEGGRAETSGLEGESRAGAH